jgi:Xaa-Pro aminopeptidase
MRYDKISNTLFIENRTNFCSKMKANTIVVLTSNDVKHNNADDVMGFTQNGNINLTKAMPIEIEDIEL